MRKLVLTILFAVFVAPGAFAAQQIGDVRPRPIFGKCPAGMELPEWN